jgi:hypothetical protein
MALLAQPTGRVLIETWRSARQVWTKSVFDWFEPFAYAELIYHSGVCGVGMYFMKISVSPTAFAPELFR